MWLAGCRGPLSFALHSHTAPLPTLLPFPAATTAAATCPQEKRKRDEGKATRGKNYVEEEKRLARSLGVYSGFDK